MKPETLAALLDSIEHHKALAKDRNSSTAVGQNCALCQRFIYEQKIMCFRIDSGIEEICPVYSKTGSRGCLNTPWESPLHDYGVLSIYNLEELRVCTDICPDGLYAEAEAREIAFLQSLLPDDFTPTQSDESKS